MKKILFKFIITLLLVFGCSKVEADFRNVNWGMSEEEVKKKETATFIKKRQDKEKKNITYLNYKTELMNFPAKLIYEFKENKLKIAMYFFEHNFKESSEIDLKDFYDKVVDDYKQINDLLIDKYGDTFEKKYPRVFDTDKDIRNLGEALLSEKLNSLSHIWDKNNMTIKHSLFSYGDSNLFHCIEYFGSDISKKEKTEALEDI